MTDYALAKELKDAGFPQGEQRIPPFEIESDSGIEFPLPHTPTLDELIEACGEGFTALVNVYDDVWFAGELDVEDSFKRGYGEGKTPEEAVAKLWLALNKK